MSKFERNGIVPPRHEPEPLNPACVPKKHTLGPAEDQLHVGSMVFYRGERHWVSICPTSWDETHHIRICNKNFRPDGAEPQDAECFSVGADCVDLVLNVPKNKYSGRQPTIKSMERAQRSKEGARDVGDEVAEILRPLTLEQMFETAANYLGEELGALQAKYEHLDNGRKRMVMGNRMRAKHKKEQS